MNQVREDISQYNYMVSEINCLYHEAAVQAGISDSVQLILYMLYVHNYHLAQSEIYKQSGTSRQTINSAIHRLEQEDIIYLEKGTGRKTIVYMTEKGKAYATEKVYPLFQIENEIFAEWTKEELHMYLSLTERYRDSLKNKLQQTNFGGHHENTII